MCDDDVNCMVGNVKKMEIYFNSKQFDNFSTGSPTGPTTVDGNEDYRLLSNFYGGAEFAYQKQKFEGKGLMDLFDSMEHCSGEEFVNYLMLLQPYKRWTDRQKCYWFRGKVPIKDGKPQFNLGVPIRGILAKLIGTSATNKARRRIVVKMAGDFKVLPEVGDTDKKNAMVAALREKFKRGSKYATLLLSTDSAVLHEKPMRKVNAWSFKHGEGGDWLGKLLMCLRSELALGARTECD